MDNHRNSDTKFVLTGTLVVFGLILISVQSDTDTNSESLNSTLPEMTARERLLAEAVDGLTPSLPLKLDEFTTLVDVFSNEQILSYSYEVSFLKEEIDYDFFVTEMTPGLLNNICTNEAMTGLNTIGTKYDYIYTSSDDILIASIRIDPDDCVE